MKPSPQTPPLTLWLPIFLLLAAIAAESTRIGGEAQTRTLLFAILNRLHLMQFVPDAGHTNKELRKIGHLCGYGLLAAATAHAFTWLLLRSSHRTWPQAARPAALLAIVCTAAIGTLDEWHQSYLPGRTSSPVDILIDTLGATVFVLLYLMIGNSSHRRGTPQFAT